VMSEHPVDENTAERPSFSIAIPKPSIIAIHGADGQGLLAIHPNGTVTGAIEDAGEAAAVFVRELRGLIAGMNADAWDEGTATNAGLREGLGMDPIQNPYRAEQGDHS
jgi:hypothetical protein